MRPARWFATVCVAIALGAAACSKQSVEDRAREQAEKIQKGIIDYEAVALEQKTTAEIVAEVQRNLAAINEYQGEVNGVLDSVTVNAIQSFQRTPGLRDDGIITEETRRKLAEAAKAKP